MAPMQEHSTEISLGDLLNLETSVLRALCLTVNAAGSELKYKILDMLSEDDFYFPINKAVFLALTAMERKGDYVVYTSLEEALRKSAVDVPEDFFIEDLFRGELPGLDELSERLGRMKERAQKGITPVADSRAPTKGRSSPSDLSSSPSLRRVEERSSSDVRPASDSRSLSQSRPAVKVSVVAKPESSPDVAKPSSKPHVTPPPKRTSSSDPALSTTKLSSSSDAKKRIAQAEREARERLLAKSSSGRKKSGAGLLASEGEDWDSYLNELASKQGKSFDTGFVGIDQGVGGLGPGLMLLVDENHDRLCAFLKQLTDQVAQSSKLPCLYLSFDFTKADLRIRTLARLSGIAARDIEKGRLKKDSPEWKKVEQCGRQAAPWLKRVFVVEADPQTGIGMVREMCQELVSSSGESTCMIVVDTLEGFGRGSESLRSAIAELKKLSDTLDVLVIAGSISTALLSDRSAHWTSVLRKGESASTELEVLKAGETKSSLLRFEYFPQISRFREVTR